MKPQLGLLSSVRAKCATSENLLLPIQLFSMSQQQVTTSKHALECCVASPVQILVYIL